MAAIAANKEVEKIARVPANPKRKQYLRLAPLMIEANRKVRWEERRHSCAQAFQIWQLSHKNEAREYIGVSAIPSLKRACPLILGDIDIHQYLRARRAYLEHL